mgnify:CR=1 FL=1
MQDQDLRGHLAQRGQDPDLDSIDRDAVAALPATVPAVVNVTYFGVAKGAVQVFHVLAKFKLLFVDIFSKIKNFDKFYLAFQAFLNNNLSLSTFITGFVVALPFYLIWFFSKGRLIGFGDIMLMCGIGFILGIASGFLAVMFSFWIGVIFILLKVIFERKLLKRDTQIPFGPFLVIGLYLVFILNLTFYKLIMLII